MANINTEIDVVGWEDIYNLSETSMLSEISQAFLDFSQHEVMKLYLGQFEKPTDNNRPLSYGDLRVMEKRLDRGYRSLWSSISNICTPSRNNITGYNAFRFNNGS